MKQRVFFPAFLLALLLALSACGQTGSREPVDLPDGLETELAFPGTSWDMTPEALIQALDLEEGSYEVKETPYGSSDSSDKTGYFILIVDEIEAFGIPSYAAFTFEDRDGGGRYWLQQLVVLCEEGTEYRTLETALTELYGEPVDDKLLGDRLTDSNADTAGQYDVWRSAFSAENLRDWLEAGLVDPSDPRGETDLSQVVANDGTLSSTVWPLGIYQGMVGVRFFSQYGRICSEAGIQ